MHIIAADDEILALETLVEAIEAACPDASVHGFRKMKELIAFAQETICEVAFLDIEMRDTKGVEIANQLKSINSQINIIFVTGYSDYMETALHMHVSGYLMKPVGKDNILYELENLRYPAAVIPNVLRIQTFGNFEVFMNGKPVDFKRSKAKELFALLVDRKGAGLTTPEIATVLWEEQAYNRSLKNQVQNAIIQLRSILVGVGAGDVLIKSWNSLSLDVSKVDCDYYNFIKGDQPALHSFTGEYMTEYSWAEITNSFLFQKLQK